MSEKSIVRTTEALAGREQRAITIAQFLAESGKHTWQIEDPAEREEAADAMLFTIERMEFPKSSEQRLFYGEEAWVYIVNLFGSKLTPGKQDLLGSILNGRATDEALAYEFARHIAGAPCERFGLVLLSMSFSFLQWYAYWEQRDPEIIERCVRSFSRRLKIIHKQKGGYLTVSREEIERSREYVRDVRLLFRRFRDEYRNKKDQPEFGDLVRFTEKQMREGPGDYPLLARDNRLFDELRRQPRIASRIMRRKVTPGQFVWSWMETKTGYRRSHLKDLKKQLKKQTSSHLP